MKIIAVIIVLLTVFGCGKSSTSTVEENEAHFTFPTNGLNVSGTITAVVEGSNIAKVGFRVFPQQDITYDEEEPFDQTINTRFLDNGENRIFGFVTYNDGEIDAMEVRFGVINL